MCSFLLFFFFKQKTAYEMRISDWSSDVCSSDLSLLGPHAPRAHQHLGGVSRSHQPRQRPGEAALGAQAELREGSDEDRIVGGDADLGRTGMRSEEQTSELQSLMRRSYAAFCLKKKNQPLNNNTYHFFGSNTQ